MIIKTCKYLTIFLISKSIILIQYSEKPKGPQCSTFNPSHTKAWIKIKSKENRLKRDQTFYQTCFLIDCYNSLRIRHDFFTRYSDKPDITRGIISDIRGFFKQAFHTFNLLLVVWNNEFEIIDLRPFFLLHQDCAKF